MLFDVERLRPAYLILWKTDRLSRDKIDAVLAKHRLRSCGVKICYVTESMPDDDEAAQILLESMYEGMAQSFLISHRKNVLRGLNYNAENARYNGRKILGYIGKPDSRYETDPQTAPVVQKIYKEYVRGTPLKEICDKLNGAGIRTIKGGEFTVNSLRCVLQNRAYIGEYHYGDYIIPDGMPKIISDELFDNAQAMFAKNNGAGHRRREGSMKMRPLTIGSRGICSAASAVRVCKGSAALQGMATSVITIIARVTGKRPAI